MLKRDQPYCHYIITLFNIGVYKTDNHSQWIDERLKLFRRFTCPSVLSNDHNFTWIIIIDISTPDEDVDRIRDAANNDDRLLILRLERTLAFNNRHSPTIRNVINEIIDTSSPLVLTTLIDSDDILSDTFLDKLYQAVDKHMDDCFPIMFEAHTEYHTAINIGMCLERHHVVSHTPTPSILSVTTQPIITVRHDWHGKLYNHCNTHVRFDASYIHTTHDHNVWSYDKWISWNTKFNKPLATIFHEYQSVFIQTAVLILSPPRSGSSCLTGCLHNLGCSLGKSVNSKTDQWNAKGYFENTKIYQFNEAHCNIFSTNTKDDTDWLKLSKIISHEFDNQQLFVIKDPRIIHLFYCYVRALSYLGINIKIILLKRQKANQSLQVFPPSCKMSHERIDNLIEWYGIEMDRISLAFDSISVNLETLKGDIQKVCVWLGIAYNAKRFESFFDKSLIHFE